MKARVQRIVCRGFTLVELLVTVAIIAVLAGLLLPALARAKQKARGAACTSNLRQIGIALHGFAHDHGGSFPQQLSTNAGGALELSRNPEPGWGLLVRSPAPFAALANELSNPRALGCPAAPPGPTSFANLRTAEVGYVALTSARLGDVQSVLAIDRNFDPVRTRRITNETRSAQLELVWTPERHGGRGNALWGDGHVEFRRSLQLALPVPSRGAPETGPTGRTSPASGGGSAGQGNGAGGSVGNGSRNARAATNPGNTPPANAPLPATAPSGTLVESTSPRAVTLENRSGATNVQRLAPTQPVSSTSAGLVEAEQAAREESERRSRRMQLGLLSLLLACMLLGLAAVLFHAWQRYRAQT